MYNRVEFSGELTMGRGRENDVLLKGGEVSRYHAMITRDMDGGYVLKDLASLNHTWVGNSPVEQYRLVEGACFRVADYLFTFEDGPEGQAGPPVRLEREISIGKYSRFDGQGTVFEHSGARLAGEFSPEHLSLLLTLTNEIVSTLDYHRFMEKALSLSMDSLGAQRGFIALLGPDGLNYSAIKGFAENGSKLLVSSTMINMVMEKGETVLTGNAVADDSFREAKSVLQYNLKSVLCAPLINAGTVIGCMYIDDPDREDSFSEQEMAFFSIVANQVALGVRNVRAYRQVRNELDSLKSRVRLRDDVVIKSKAMEKVYALVDNAARTNATVFIHGPTGAGKELVARRIHEMSGRKGRFVPVNCSAIPDDLVESELFGHERGSFTGADRRKIGLFELASGGTLFLDEIGEMELSRQAKLLRAIQDRKIKRVGGTEDIPLDVRIVSATNRDLKQMIRDKEFREDLYYRLTQVIVEVPPLKERKAAILPLANKLLSRFCGENDLDLPILSRKAREALLEHDWPGNINELRNVLIQACLNCDGHIIEVEDLPAELGEKLGIGPSEALKLSTIEEQHIRKVLRITKGNRKKAAELLGIAKDTIYKKMKRYGIT